tara:strand:+ start:80 stop:520 length:441 start_codon:yes stop_codon:yes gene_type:complete
MEILSKESINNTSENYKKNSILLKRNKMIFSDELWDFIKDLTFYFDWKINHKKKLEPSLKKIRRNLFRGGNTPGIYLKTKNSPWSEHILNLKNKHLKGMEPIAIQKNGCFWEYHYNWSTKAFDIFGGQIYFTKFKLQIYGKWSLRL